jgi:hypothetical protein
MTKHAGCCPQDPRVCPISKTRLSRTIETLSCEADCCRYGVGLVPYSEMLANRPKSSPSFPASSRHPPALHPSPLSFPASHTPPVTARQTSAPAWGASSYVEGSRDAWGASSYVQGSRDASTIVASTVVRALVVFVGSVRNVPESVRGSEFAISAEHR